MMDEQFRAEIHAAYEFRGAASVTLEWIKRVAEGRDMVGASSEQRLDWIAAQCDRMLALIPAAKVDA